MDKAFVPETIYFYPEDKLGDEEEMIVSIRQDEALNKYLSEQNVARGDVVVLAEEDGYSNEYRFLYDGTRIVTLDYSYPPSCDYGIIPREFVTLREFPLNYWCGALLGWNMIWIPCSDSMQKELAMSDEVVIEGQVIRVVIEDEESRTREQFLADYFFEHRIGNLLCVRTHGESTSVISLSF